MPVDPNSYSADPGVSKVGGPVSHMVLMLYLRLNHPLAHHMHSQNNGRFTTTTRCTTDTR